MVRAVVTFFAVWIAVGAIGVLIQATIAPVASSVVGVIGLVLAAIAAFLVYRRQAP